MDTIVAIATPPGRGGVGIVRISGKLAYAIALKITKKNEIIARQAYYLPFYTQNDELLDKGLILSFKAPHSFTGEDIIELHAHGSPIVLDNIVKECITYGARIAKTQAVFCGGVFFFYNN